MIIFLIILSVCDNIHLDSSLNIHPSTNLISVKLYYINTYGNGGGKASGILTSGCSMGGFHSANFFFRRPDIFDSLISLSGLYSSKYFIGDYMDGEVYVNSVLDYVGNMNEDYYLNLYRHAKIVICTGQGNWETEMVAETKSLSEVLQRKNIPAWIDFWGHDVHHDWPFWRMQMPYFLSHIL